MVEKPEKPTDKGATAPEKQAQAGNRPEEANWEGSEDDLAQFRKYAKLAEKAVAVKGPYPRKDGRQLLNIVRIEL